MDESIKQLGQDLAMAKYAKSTCRTYLSTAEHLSNLVSAAIGEADARAASRVREEISGLGKSASWLGVQICALSYLYRKTLGRPDVVSFLSSPKRSHPLPTVLSLEEVQVLTGRSASRATRRS